MIGLSSTTSYLVLKRPTPRTHEVEVHGQFNSALESWTDASRVSPIFPTRQAKQPVFRKGKRSWILFAGPIFPADINPRLAKSLFLSLGTYNAVFFVVSEAQRDDLITAIQRQRSVRWEEWTLDGNSVRGFRVSSSSQPALPAQLRKPFVLSKDLLSSVREYVTLIATAVGRASVSQPGEEQALVKFDSLLRPLLKSSDLTAITRQALLVNTNAALSRQTSQAYAGTSPIFETECHFWTHSLLGVGTATRALSKTRAFIHERVTTARLLDRLRLLSNCKPTTTDILHLEPSDEFWDTPHLEAPEVATGIASEPEPTDEIPQITFFSGRDGFRSTQVSLSAPLELITACNTYAWTPLTLTHEVSHTVIEGALGLLLPHPDRDVPGCERLAGFIERKAQPANLLEQLRTYLAYWVTKMNGSDAAVSGDSLRAAIRTQWREVNELMTHAFDFMYFYQREAESYVASIWTSWGVIPNIGHRIPEYLSRTLCALHLNNIRRDNALETTLDACAKHLDALIAESPLARSARDTLLKERDTYRDRLRRRSPLVKLVRAFLFLPSLSHALFADPSVSGPGGAGFPAQPLEFPDNRISNPLRFMSSFATGKIPDANRSAWMLTMLGFPGRG